MDFINDTDRFDQHFLIDQIVIEKLLEMSSLTKNDIVVEVGSGKGNITKLIAPRVKKVYAIELDRRLKPFLDKIVANNIEFIYESVIDTYIPECDKVITCLPYSIIEPFIIKMVKCKAKEIIMITGNRYATNVDTQAITKLGLLTNCYFKSEKIMEITPDAFEPKPHVMSAMLKLTLKSEEEIIDKTLLLFRYMFLYHDKKIKNGLIESFIKLYKINGDVLTQKMSKQIIDNLQIPNEILIKQFSTCSNEELKKLYEIINDYFKEK